MSYKINQDTNEFRYKINKHKQYLTKDTESKMNQSEILELKNLINELKNALQNTGTRADHMEERISKLEDRNR